MRSTGKSTAPQRQHATSNLTPASSTHPGYAAPGWDGRLRPARCSPRPAPVRGAAVGVRVSGRTAGRRRGSVPCRSSTRTPASRGSWLDVRGGASASGGEHRRTRSVDSGPPSVRGSPGTRREQGAARRRHGQRPIGCFAARHSRSASATKSCTWQAPALGVYLFGALRGSSAGFT